MTHKNKTLEQVIASAIAVAGLAASPTVLAGFEPPRGADVDELAGNCNIGPFPQLSKAGPYNELCNIMEDSEKCLGFIKRQFHFNGETVTVSKFHEGEADKGRYCLEVLNRDLGVDGND